MRITEIHALTRSSNEIKITARNEGTVETNDFLGDIS